MVHEDFFFIINYLSTIHTSVDDLEFFLQVTKSLDHLRGEVEVDDTFTISPLAPMNGGTFHRGKGRAWEQG